jgi:serine/threonine-protein kinase
VYLAEQDSGSGFKRLVALKLLDAHASRSKEISRRMRDEARLLGRISSRHIVDVFDLVLLDERWAVVMEFVPGADLEQVLRWMEPRQDVFSAAAAFEVVHAVAKALVAAWSADDGSGRPLHVVHRDLKPANIRLTPDGEIKVLDFGVARFTMEEREASTRKPGWLGTERYMAPERILLEGDGPAGDVYALGATVIELLIGRPLGRTPVREEPHRAMVEEALADVAARLEGDAGDKAAALDLLRSMVAAQPEARPDASAVVASAGPLARRLGGASLAALAGAMPADVASSEAVAPMVMEERSGGSLQGEPVSAPAPASATTVDEPDDTSADETGRWRMLWVLPVVWAAIFVFMLVPSPRPPRIGGEPVVLPPAQLEVASPAEVAAPPAEVPQPLAVAPAPSAEAAAIGAPGATREAAKPDPKPAEPGRTVARQEGAVKVAAPAPEVRTLPVEPAPAAADAPRVSRAQVVVEEVDSFTVRCGDKSSEGTVSARIVNFPAGTCAVRAMVGGKVVSGSVLVTGPREVRCRVDGEALRCS